ncbi:thioredoxin-2 isoform X2 [Orussus abietinus]|uniref:thioredoxin-2 isoform X2 n=1 Tax=Orussus abietinus TaxID=222816 RepID=UPI0006263644|nr:thioredoxin-2 isoform X2 [Orussus abietinus]
MVYAIKDEADLQEKLKEAGNKLVVIDFYATWCGPCKMIAPKLETLSEEMDDIVILKVDVDQCEALVSDYDVTSMPTFVFIKNGEKLESFSGANYEKLKELILKHK